MDFYETLNLEGTEKYQVLTYFYCRLKGIEDTLREMRTQFEAPHCKVFYLYDDEWPVGVILVEAIFTASVKAAAAIVDTSILATHLDGVIGSVCIFDGIFCGHDEVFSSCNMEHIYFTWIRQGSLNLAMSGALRASNEWHKTILDFRDQVRASTAEEN